MALTGITAIWAIEDTAQLRAGETILIQGGAGGVAGFAIQLAKYLGATVVTTTSAANIDYVRTLGAPTVSSTTTPTRARSRRRPSRDTISQTPPKLTVSARSSPAG